MSLSSFLPQAKEPGQILNESAANVQSILASILAGKQNQQKISQKEMANQQLNEYRQQQLAETKNAHQQLNDYRNKQLSLGYLKETPSEKSQREIQTSYQKALGESDVKTLGKWNDVISASEETRPALENLQRISSNPIFQNMYKNPEYFGKDIEYLNRFGKPEEIKMLSEFGTNNKQLYSTMSQEFKGAFRKFEKGLFDKALASEKDTLPSIIAKTNAMMTIKELVSKRLKLADNIVRSSGGKISPSNALDIADKQINSDKVRKDIENQFNDLEKKQKVENKIENKEKKEKTIPLYKNGRQYNIPAKFMWKALKEGGFKANAD